MKIRRPSDIPFFFSNEGERILKFKLAITKHPAAISYISWEQFSFALTQSKTPPHLSPNSWIEPLWLYHWLPQRVSNAQACAMTNVVHWCSHRGAKRLKARRIIQKLKSSKSEGWSMTITSAKTKAEPSYLQSAHRPSSYSKQPKSLPIVHHKLSRTSMWWII